MPAIVAFPQAVEEALSTFSSVFKNEPERRHFGEYLTGLMIAQRKTVLGMTSEFVEASDQSCLNRWLTEVSWDPKELNRQRLAWLQTQWGTGYSRYGVIALDNTLVDHAGKLIEDVGYFWDHAEERYKLAHDYLIANYVCSPSGLHYPLDFRRYRKREEYAKGETYKTHDMLLQELVTWAVEEGIPGDFTFDCYFSSAANMNFIQAKGRNYVADLKFNRKVWFKGEELKASVVAACIPPDDRKQLSEEEGGQWYFTKSIRMREVDHPVRILILWDRKNGAQPVKILLTNKAQWEAHRIIEVYRKRWTGTETFHRDGKQELGLGDCQLRSGEGQNRHLYLVMTAYSLLVAKLRQGGAREWGHQLIKTIGEACRGILRETLGKTIDWVIRMSKQESLSKDAILSKLALD